VTTPGATNILHTSPLDQNYDGSSPDDDHGLASPDRLIPSRFNIHATTNDGQLVLWNTYSGAMNAFSSDQREPIRTLLHSRSIKAEKNGIVSYLAERGYLIPDGTDELRRIRYAFGQEQYRSDLLELILLASEDCNFRCKYCYEAFARGTMRPDVRASVKKLVEQRLQDLSTLRIAWFGGEPLYGFRALEDLAPWFTDIADRHGLAFASHMTTNGYLLTEEVASKLLSWRITDYQITVDGTPEDHDSHRPTRDGDGTFDVIYRNLAALRERKEDFSVQIRVNYDRENCTRLSEFLDLLQRTFKDDPRFSVGFHAVGRWGGPNDADIAVCGKDEAREMATMLKEEARARGLNIGMGLAAVRGPGSQVCYAARPYNFIIGASGKVMKCTIDLDAQDHNVVGQLRQDGELELDQDKMALWTEPAFERDSGCRSCATLPTCQGMHCPKIRIDQNRSPCPDTRRNVKQLMVERLAVKTGKPQSRGRTRQGTAVRVEQKGDA